MSAQSTRALASLVYAAALLCTAHGGDSCAGGGECTLDSTCVFTCDCISCPPGSMCPSGHNFCVESCGMEPCGEYYCRAGTYSPGGTSSCYTCPAGRYSHERASGCTDCAEGQVSDDGAEYCHYCSSGRAPTRNQDGCITCPRGTYSAYGDSECWTCSVGKACANAGCGSCSSCNAGKSSTVDRTSCEDCGMGRYSASGSRCQMCSIGQICSDTGCRKCESCDAGRSSTTGNTRCESCAAGKYSAHSGERCDTCPQGQVCEAPGGCTQCTDCPAGLVAGAAHISCAKCGPGKETHGDACTDCEAGQFSTSGSCEPCSRGQFSVHAAPNCTNCTAGRYSGDAATECSTCDAGQYSSAGDSNCGTCRSGQFSGPAASSCTSCAAGRSSARGSDECADCEPGRFSRSGDPNCDSCPPGQYSLHPATRACNICPAGKFQSGERAPTSCAECPSGTVSSPRAGNCTACQLGKFSGAGEAGSVCKSCDVGGYCDHLGCESCRTCAIGSVSNLTGCVACERESVAGQVPSGTTECSSTLMLQCPNNVFDCQRCSSQSDCSSSEYCNSHGVCDVCESLLMMSSCDALHGDCCNPELALACADTVSMGGCAFCHGDVMRCSSAILIGVISLSVIGVLGSAGWYVNGLHRICDLVTGDCKGLQGQGKAAVCVVAATFTIPRGIFFGFVLAHYRTPEFDHGFWYPCLGFFEVALTLNAAACCLFVNSKPNLNFGQPVVRKLIATALMALYVVLTVSILAHVFIASKYSSQREINVVSVTFDLTQIFALQLLKSRITSVRDADSISKQHLATAFWIVWDLANCMFMTLLGTWQPWPVGSAIMLLSLAILGAKLGALGWIISGVFWPTETPFDIQSHSTQLHIVMGIGTVLAAAIAMFKAPALSPLGFYLPVCICIGLAPIATPLASSYLALLTAACWFELASPLCIMGFLWVTTIAAFVRVPLGWTAVRNDGRLSHAVGLAPVAIHLVYTLALLVWLPTSITGAFGLCTLMFDLGLGFTKSWSSLNLEDGTAFLCFVVNAAPLRLKDGFNFPIVAGGCVATTIFLINMSVYIGAWIFNVELSTPETVVSLCITLLLLVAGIVTVVNVPAARASLPELVPDSVHFVTQHDGQPFDLVTWVAQWLSIATTAIMVLTMSDTLGRIVCVVSVCIGMLLQATVHSRVRNVKAAMQTYAVFAATVDVLPSVCYVFNVQYGGSSTVVGFMFMIKVVMGFKAVIFDLKANAGNSTARSWNPEWSRKINAIWIFPLVHAILVVWSISRSDGVSISAELWSVGIPDGGPTFAQNSTLCANSELSSAYLGSFGQYMQCSAPEGIAVVDSAFFGLIVALFMLFYGEYICETKGGGADKIWRDSKIATFAENALQIALSCQVLYSMLRIRAAPDSLYACMVTLDLLCIVLIMLSRQLREDYNDVSLVDWGVMFFLESWDVANSLWVTVALARETDPSWPLWVADAYVIVFVLTLLSFQISYPFWQDLRSIMICSFINDVITDGPMVFFMINYSLYENSTACGIAMFTNICIISFAVMIWPSKYLVQSLDAAAAQDARDARANRASRASARASMRAARASARASGVLGQPLLGGSINGPDGIPLDDGNAQVDGKGKMLPYIALFAICIAVAMTVGIFSTSAPSPAAPSLESPSIHLPEGATAQSFAIAGTTNNDLSGMYRKTDETVCLLPTSWSDQASLVACAKCHSQPIYVKSRAQLSGTSNLLLFLNSQLNWEVCAGQLTRSINNDETLDCRCNPVDTELSSGGIPNASCVDSPAEGCKGTWVELESNGVEWDINSNIHVTVGDGRTESDERRQANVEAIENLVDAALLCALSFSIVMIVGPSNVQRAWEHEAGKVLFTLGGWLVAQQQDEGEMYKAIRKCAAVPVFGGPLAVALLPPWAIMQLLRKVAKGSSHCCR